MKPDIWGPMAWSLLHSITLEYPETPSQLEKDNMRQFINSFGKVLPCDKCKINFINHLEELPLTDIVLASRTNFIKWMIDVHNSVNRMNNKKELSYHEALKNMLIISNGTNNYGDNKNLVIIMLVTIIIIMVCVVSYRYFS